MVHTTRTFGVELLGAVGVLDVRRHIPLVLRVECPAKTGLTFSRHSRDVVEA